MPNWTYCTIQIQGQKEDLERFMKDAVRREDGTLALSSWIPTPETFEKYDTTNHPNGEGLKVGDKWWDGLGQHDALVTEELIEEFKRATEEQMRKYGVVGWYDYNILTFGCKWDCEVTIEDEGDTFISLATETPWSAPEVWLLTLSRRYPELTFGLHADYEEGFWEDSVFQGGMKDFLATGNSWEDEEEEEA